MACCLIAFISNKHEQVVIWVRSVGMQHTQQCCLFLTLERCSRQTLVVFSFWRQSVAAILFVVAMANQQLTVTSLSVFLRLEAAMMFIGLHCVSYSAAALNGETRGWVICDYRLCDLKC